MHVHHACHWAYKAVQGSRTQSVKSIGDAGDELWLLPHETTLLVYIGGSDSWAEWKDNVREFVGDTGFAGATVAASAILKSEAASFARVVLVGYSRGASIALAVANAIPAVVSAVVTLGDPGLVTHCSTPVCSLFNEFDFVYGIAGPPVGVRHQLSHARLQRRGWTLALVDVGIHTNYGVTLADEPGVLAIVDPHLS